MAEITTGRVLNDKWTLGPLLGMGGAGAVYAATHRNGIRAAVKILHPVLAADEAHVARFLREGYIANQLEHEGVVAALDDDRTEDGHVYLVFELLEGAPLSEVVERRAPLPVAEAFAIAGEILAVLEVAHGKGVIHRDVKPANVFVLKSGAIKLLDFGVARAGELAGKGRDPGEGFATQMGSVLGTPGFMAPEQARGRLDLIDGRTDVWATAALLFSMLTGQRLHAAATTNESLARAMLEPAPPIRSRAPGLSPLVASIVDRGLAFNREARFRTAGEMLAAVRRALPSETREISPSSSWIAPPPPLSRPAQPVRPSRKIAPIAALVVVVLALLALGWRLDETDSSARSHGLAASSLVFDVAPPSSSDPGLESDARDRAAPIAAPALVIDAGAAVRPRPALAPSSSARPVARISAAAPPATRADPLGERR